MYIYTHIIYVRGEKCDFTCTYSMLHVNGSICIYLTPTEVKLESCGGHPNNWNCPTFRPKRSPTTPSTTPPKGRAMKVIAKPSHVTTAEPWKKFASAIGAPEKQKQIVWVSKT